MNNFGFLKSEAVVTGGNKGLSISIQRLGLKEYDGIRISD
jgi:hypothetical protein